MDAPDLFIQVLYLLLGIRILIILTDKNVRNIIMQLFFPFANHGAVNFMLSAQFSNCLNFLERLQRYARLELFRILNSLLHPGLLVEGFIIPHFYTLTSGLNSGKYYKD